MNKPNLFILHPKLRDYRLPLFRLLGESYRLKFFLWKKETILHDFDAIYSKKHSISYLLSLKDIRVMCNNIKTSDIVLTSFLSNAYSIATIVIAFFCRIPVIVWEEKTQIFPTFKGRIRKAVDSFFAKFVSAFFVLGDPQRKALLQLGVPQDKIFVANEYPGINYKDVDSKPVPGLDHKDKVMILFMGRFVGFKGVNVLLEAFKALEDQVSNLLLICVGTGPKEAELKAYASALGIKNIIFPGYIADVHEKKYLLTHAKMLVVPSIISKKYGCEGGPLIVLEALSAGTPVLGTNGLISSEQFIQNGINGYIVSHSDVMALKEGMEAILEWNDPEEVKKRVFLSFQKIKGHSHQCLMLKSAFDYGLKLKLGKRD